MENVFRVQPSKGFCWWTIGWGRHTADSPVDPLTEGWLKLGPASLMTWESGKEFPRRWEIEWMNRVIVVVTFWAKDPSLP